MLTLLVWREIMEISHLRNYLRGMFERVLYRNQQNNSNLLSNTPIWDYFIILFQFFLNSSTRYPFFFANFTFWWTVEIELPSFSAASFKVSELARAVIALN